ncbi:MAG: transcription termination/antitermination protein NusA [Dehalococcoidales bacterium]|nr:transcription termination/antitermination protein NusA [Dehalococcoidales bacterium]
MKSDFLLAITQLSAEKNLSKEVVLGAVEAALASAYRKNSFAPNQEISVKINPASGRVEVWAEKTVVEQVSDSRCEVSLKEALKLNPDTQLEDTIYIEDTPHNAGRIAAQTAKQVILQRLHEAEHSAIYEEYTDKQGDIITGMIRRIESRQVFVDLGRSEAIMPQAEQAPNERYRVGQRLKVYLVEVSQTAKGPVLIVSRSHPNLLRRLFELEVPEIYNGTVEIKAVAREAGFRSKVAVAARQEGIDPVGCCVGLRGIRIQNIVNELNGEKIDVVAWSSDMATFITSAISPAQVAHVELHEEQSATVVIPDRQLSLAIGKEGQNVRLAVKLTGWRIDIKGASEHERERAEAAKDEVPADEELGAEVPEPSPVSAEVTPQAAEAFTEVAAAPAVDVKPIRFAEEVLATAKAKPQTKDKKKKKKTARKESAVDGIRLKKKRRVAIPEDEDEETDYY